MIFYQEPIATLYCGHALELKELPAESVDMCMTSPPYWGLRSYKTEPQIWDSKDGCRHEFILDNSNTRIHKGWSTGTRTVSADSPSANYDHFGKAEQGQFCSLCGAWRGELGLEPTIELYIKHLIQIFNEVKRVLKKTGTCWVNIDDSYNAGSGGDHKPGGKNDAGFQGKTFRGVQPKYLKTLSAKSLCLIPQRFAIAMVEDDSGDIYELDKGYMLWYNDGVRENITDAIQGQREGKDVSKGIPEEEEGEAPSTIQGISEEVAERESRKGKAIQPQVLLGEQGAGDSTLHQGQCEAAQNIEISGTDSLRGKPAEVPMLRGTQDSLSINRPYQWVRSGTPEGNQAYRLDIRMAKEGEIPSRLQGFVHELQHGSRLLWFLPPSRGRNLRLRKSDIPIDLLQYFNLLHQERWLVRNDIVWNKPNPMPESVKDRFTGSWEHLFFFVKSNTIQYWTNPVTGAITDKQPLGTKGKWGIDWIYRKTSKKERNRVSLWQGHTYFFEQQFEPITEATITRNLYPHSGGGPYALNRQRNPGEFGDELQGRNKRDVWEFPTISCPFPGVHFATFPEKLCETPILAGCPSMICKKCGKAREKIYKTEPMKIRRTNWGEQAGNRTASSGTMLEPNKSEFLGYTDCGCNAGYESGVVLDPFCGSGTALAVAKRLGRKSIGIDISENYCKLTVKRIQGISLPMELV